MADNGFSMHTVPSGSFTGNETSEQPIIQLMSSELLSTDAMIPFIQASNQNTKTSIEQQQKLSDENDRKYEAVKEMIKASEKYRTIERLAFNIVKRNSEGTAETLSVQSKKGKGYVDRMVGPEIVGDEPKMSCAFSLWVCCRIGKDLNLYWGTEQIGVHNSTFLVMLFGVQNRDGHSPYTTAIGKELEIQARDVVGRLLWSARCSSPEGIGYIGSVPRWLFSLVPMVRQFFVGSCNRIEGPSNNASNSISHESGSCGIVQHQTLSNGSARQSEPIMIDDYHDLAVQNAAWMRERDYFKDSVAKGCRAVEEKKTRDKSRKVSRIAQLDVSSPQSINLNLREAQEKITQGAEAMRKRVSKQLSPNRFNCRQQFCEAIGLMLNTFKKDGKEDAIKKGFAVEVPMLSAQEKDIFESRDIFNSSILTARTLEGGNESEVHETNLRELQDMAERFPCLVLKLKYPVTIVDAGSGSGNMEGNQEIPNKYIQEETLSLISLSVVVLKEYTHSGHTRSFFAKPKKSMHAVIIIVMAMRALIRRSLEFPLNAFETHILGNVYFDDAEVPANVRNISSILGFKNQEANVKRLNKKLTTTKKKYLEQQGLKQLPASEPEPNQNSEDEENEDDVFFIPSAIA